MPRTCRAQNLAAGSLLFPDPLGCVVVCAARGWDHWSSPPDGDSSQNSTSGCSLPAAETVGEVSTPKICQQQ